MISIIGLALGLAYLALVVGLAAKVVVKDSYGGLFTEEFGLFVVTLPGSPLVEKLLKRHRYRYCRVAAYLLFGLANASLLYLAGMGLDALLRRP